MKVAYRNFASVYHTNFRSISLSIRSYTFCDMKTEEYSINEPFSSFLPRKNIRQSERPSCVWGGEVYQYVYSSYRNVICTKGWGEGGGCLDRRSTNGERVGCYFNSHGKTATGLLNRETEKRNGVVSSRQHRKLYR